MEKYIRYFRNKLSNKRNIIFNDEHQRIVLEALDLKDTIASWQGSDYREKISIGENCNTAWYLKQTSNKAASYPYDWIFSSPQIIEHTLQNDFQLFLNKELIISKGDRAGHKFYHSNLFNHRNPLKSEKDYDYYTRCVERLNKIIKSKEPLIFICTVINEPEKRPGWINGFDREINKPKRQTIDDFMSLIDSIKSINSSAKFCFIEQYTEGKLSLELTFRNENTLWLRYTSKFGNDGVKYLDNFDDLIAKIIYKGFSQVIHKEKSQ